MDKRSARVVLITGAGRGSGRALALGLAERGHTLALNDISPVNVEQVLEEIIVRGGRARAYIDDVAKKVGAQNVVNQVLDDFSRIDILINHAAVEPHVPLLEMDEWDWHRVLDVNLTGAFLMTQSVGRVMRSQGSGVIVNLVAGSAREQGRAAAFLASMKGLAELVNQAQRELSVHGIEVYAVESDPEHVLKRVLDLPAFQEERMKELTEYRTKLIARFKEAAEAFRRECLAAKDPYAPIEENGWSVHQLAVHTRDVDKLVYGLRARRTAAEEDPEFPNFDGEAYMKQHYDPGEPLSAVLDGFTQNVEALVEMLETLPGETWSRVSRHTMLGGGLTFQLWVEKDLAHIEEHLASVRQYNR